MMVENTVEALHITGIKCIKQMRRKMEGHLVRWAKIKRGWLY